MTYKETEINTPSGDFILNNNGNKYDRAKEAAGMNASPQEILAHYDKFAGLIKNKEGRVVENGIFWEAYSKWLSEKPEFIKILDQREKTLNEAEDSLIQSASFTIGHKRAFLGTLMTISAGTIAGLFFLFTKETNLSNCFILLAKISGLGHAVFILASSAWLTHLLAQESISTSNRLDFIRSARAEFVEKVGTEITGLDSYQKYRDSKKTQEESLNKTIWADTENWFRGLCTVFVFSSIPLIFMFLLN